jgi:predicted permease
LTIPRWAAALLRLLGLPGRTEDAIGDLNEMHARHVARRGRIIGGTFTAFGAVDMGAALLRQRIRRTNMESYRREWDYRLPGDGHRNGRRWDMGRFFDDWKRDFAHAARSLGRARGFTVVTVLTLALAIGANTTIFSLVDAVLIDPLGFPHADRLVSIRGAAPGTDLPEEFGVGTEFYVQYKENASALADLGLYQIGQTTVRAGEFVERLFISTASPTLFSTLGVTPQMGRLPTADDEEGTVIVLSHWLWTDWFGNDPSVVGKAYEVSGDLRTVIGIMPPDFRFPTARTALWVHDLPTEPIRPGGFGLNLVGRLAPGADHETLTAELAELAKRLPERFGGPPQYARIIEAHRPIVRSLEEEVVGDVAGPLWLLLGTVGIVLLIACANVANLFTVRAEGRSHNLAVRQALGAGRGGLVRTQMAEALLLAVLGGVGGAILARIGLPLLVRIAPENIPNLDQAGINGVALLFTVGVAALTACAFGLIPAIRFSRPRFVGAMRQTTGVGGRGRHYGRDALVLLQTAMALVLLVGSGLLLRSFWTLSHVDPGYDTRDIFSFQVAPDREGVNDGPSFAEFHRQFMAQVAELPGVTSVGLTNFLPLDEGAATNTFVTDESVGTGVTPPPMRFTMVGGDYFGTMGIELRIGRLLDRNDDVVGPTNVVVSTSAAAQFWPNQDPLNRRLAISENDTTNWMTVVGVVEDIYVEDLRQDAATPMIYLPMVGPTARRWAAGSPAYVVRTARADVIAPEVRDLMRQYVAESPMYRVFTMEELADRSMAQLSFTMLLLAIASGLALTLGAVGLYGVLSYVVTNRTHEIAVRMALGAQADRVLTMVVAQGARITLAGVAAGLLAAFFLTGTLDSLLYGVETFDLPTFVGVSVVMVAVALLASYIPARRASSVDPMEALRTE